MTVDEDKGVLRAFDAEVAEKVMGFRWFHCKAKTGVERNQFLSEDQAETWRELDWTLTEITTPPPPDQLNDDSGTPRYSADINAAMLVVEKMQERGSQVVMRSWEGAVPWSVKFISYTSKDEAEEDGDNLPEAICRAALKATE